MSDTPFRAIVCLVGGLLLAGCGGEKSSGDGHATAAVSAVDLRDQALGLEAGRIYGKEHAEAGAGVPTDVGFRAIARMGFSNAGATDPDKYEKGFREGLFMGYRGVKTLPDLSGLVALDWGKLASGMKIYNASGEVVATLASFDRSKDEIVLNFVSGSTEPKTFSAVRDGFFTR